MLCKYALLTYNLNSKLFSWEMLFIIILLKLTPSRLTSFWKSFKNVYNHVYLDDVKIIIFSIYILSFKNLQNKILLKLIKTQLNFSSSNYVASWNNKYKLCSCWLKQSLIIVFFYRIKIYISLFCILKYDLVICISHYFVFFILLSNFL